VIISERTKIKNEIGDTPYSIEGAAGSMDNLPLIKPWEL
jgi:hypothetical protein